MAVATLAKLANNADVYTGVVKIRKGQALRLLMDGACGCDQTVGGGGGCALPPQSVVVLEARLPSHATDPASPRRTHCLPLPLPLP
jgi:hypothetical protein